MLDARCRMRVGKGGFRYSVQDRRPEEDRTEVGPRPVQLILCDQRSRFGRSLDFPR